MPARRLAAGTRLAMSPVSFFQSKGLDKLRVYQKSNQ